MNFWVCGSSDAESPLSSNECDQLVGMAEAVRVRYERIIAPWRVSPQRHDIFDFCLRVFLQQIRQLVSAVPYAREMRHRFNADLAFDALRYFNGFAPGAASRTVGH